MQPSWVAATQGKGLYYQWPVEGAWDQHTLVFISRGSLRAHVWKCASQQVIHQKRVDEPMREIEVGTLPGCKEQLRMEDGSCSRLQGMADHLRP